jgi:dihydrolipoamide dehydrogenase
VLIERYSTLGGVCLNVAAFPPRRCCTGQGDRRSGGNGPLRRDFRQADNRSGQAARLEESVVRKLTGGLAGMAKQRKVSVVTGASRALSMRITSR